MRESKVKSEVLEIIATNQILSANSINLITKNRSDYNYTKKIIADAVLKNQLRVETFKEKGSRGEITRHLYSITRQGMIELISSTNTDWARFIDLDELKRATLFGSKKIKERQKIKLARINDAKFMAICAGAYISPEELTAEEMGLDNSEDDDVKSLIQETKNTEIVLENENKNSSVKSFARLIKIAYEDASLEEEQNIESPEITDDYIEFTSSLKAKNEMLAGKNELDYRDYNRCSFDGILSSKKKFLMLYTAYSVGRPWKDWTIKKDLSLASMWNQEKTAFRPPAPTIFGENFEGMLFIKNSVQLAQIFKVSYKKNELIGKGYKNFYACPMTSEGQNHLRFIMTSDTKQYEEKIILKLESEGYRRNTVYHPETFFMISANEKLVINGTLLDIRLMQEVKRYYEYDGDNIPEIVCLEWQKPYYEKTLKFLKLTTI